MPLARSALLPGYQKPTPSNPTWSGTLNGATQAGPSCKPSTPGWKAATTCTQPAISVAEMKSPPSIIAASRI